MKSCSESQGWVGGKNHCHLYSSADTADERRRRKPKLLLLGHLSRGRRSSISDSLLGSITPQLSSLLLQCHVVELIVSQGLKEDKSKLNIFSETTPELIYHALLIRHVLLGKARELLEQLVVVIDIQRALLQIAEFLTLAFNHALRNMMSSEISTEIIPSDNTSTSGVLVLLEPFCSLIFELEGSELEKVLRPDVTALEMLTQIHKPIVNKVASTQLLKVFGPLARNWLSVAK